MRINKIWMIFIFLVWAFQQTICAGTLSLTSGYLPPSFQETQENQIVSPELLAPFFEKIKKGEQQVRVLHLGDSHVRGHVFPVEARLSLEQVWGDSAVYHDKITYKTSAFARETGKFGLIYHAFGINGATYEKFNQEHILAKFDTLNPDLIILSFGTNEAHGVNYTEQWQVREMDKLIQALRSRFPQTGFLLTTPPGSYWKKRVRVTSKSGKKVYVTRHILNEQVETVANTQLIYGEEHDIPVWDLYHVVGGHSYACRNWRRAGLQSSDYIHYTKEGYTLQGKLLAEALIKAYQDYETNTD